MIYDGQVGSPDLTVLNMLCEPKHKPPSLTLKGEIIRGMVALLRFLGVILHPQVKCLAGVLDFIEAFVYLFSKIL